MLDQAGCKHGSSFFEKDIWNRSPSNAKGKKVIRNIDRKNFDKKHN